MPATKDEATKEQRTSDYDQLMELWDKFVELAGSDDMDAANEAIAAIDAKSASMGLRLPLNSVSHSVLPGMAKAACSELGGLVMYGTPVKKVEPIDLQPSFTRDGEIDDMDYCPNAPYFATPSKAKLNRDFRNAIELATCERDKKRGKVDVFFGHIIDTSRPEYAIVVAALTKSGTNKVRFDAYGYPLIELPHHPMSVNGCVQVHRIVMESYLLDNHPEHPALIGYSDFGNGETDRILSPAAIVRHKDGDRSNFTLENLELLNKDLGDLDATLHRVFAKMNKIANAITQIVDHLNGESADYSYPSTGNGDTGSGTGSSGGGSGTTH